MTEKRTRRKRVPRPIEEEIIPPTTIRFTKKETDWLRARGGIAPVVRKLIRNAMEICEQIDEPAREPHEEPVT